MKTLIFKDMLNRRVWFKLDGKLLTAPINPRQNVFFPLDSGSPNYFPKYTQDYVEHLLLDEDTQRNYAGMENEVFFEVETKKLNQMITGKSNEVIVMKEQEWD
jgi:hypothetical protein